MLITMAINPEDEDEFNRWYNEEHVPELLARPGVLGARRFKVVEEQFEHENALNYLAVYELESVDTLQHPEYIASATNPTEWTKRITELRLGGRRHVYEEVPIE